MTANVDKAAAVALFSDGGEMGDRLQQVDWNETPFGPIAQWPQSLKTTVKICVDASSPMAVWWRVDTSSSRENRSDNNGETTSLEMICNDAYALSLGASSFALRSPSEVAYRHSSQTATSTIHTSKTGIEPVIRTVLATGKTARQEHQWKDDEQNTRSFSSTYSPLLDDAGTFSGVFVSAVETTAQKRVEAAQSRMKAEVLHCEAAIEQNEQKAQRQIKNVLESISDAFIALDKQWRYTYVNRKAAQLLRQESESLVGQPVWKDAFPGRVGTLAYKELYRAVQEGVPVVFEDYSPSFDTWFEVHGYPSAEGLSIYFQDVSDRKKEEAAKEKRLAEEQTARAAAETANRLKDEFLAVVSHELRSPLNPILGCAKLLKKAELAPERKAQALDSIERNARIQAQLINDLLDVSRIMQGELVLNTCSVPVSPAIQSTIQALSSEALGKDISIETHFKPPAGSVLADPSRFHQILWNLLSNAIKFTPRSGKVIIQVEQVERQMKFSVTDTGKGIRSSFLPHVFDRFRQEDAATTRQFGGLGLGLSIVRHLVELHHGTVEASSPGEDQGATFTFFLPLGNSLEKAVKNGNRKQALNRTLTENQISNRTTVKETEQSPLAK